MQRKKPLVVFVFAKEGRPTSTRYGGFATRLQKNGGLQDKEVLTVALENLAFLVRENKEAQVIDTVSGRNLGEADFVYMKSWGDETAALATFLFYKGIPFMDSAAMRMQDTKLTSAFRLWGANLPTPFTLYVRRPDRLLQFLATHELPELSEKFIFKDVNGAKGSRNFCINRAEVANITATHPDIQFVCQRYIENDGDYRIGVYGSVPRFAIKRVGRNGTHLNNVSAGGSATHLDIAQLPKPLLRLSVQAADAVDLQIAGVDILEDRNTGKPYVLEINRGSQIVTGAFVTENIAAFNEGIDSIVRTRYAKPRNKPMPIIGRRAKASLLDLGIETITAKIDTGAYTSALHAKDIHIEHDELVFTVPLHPHATLRDGTPKVVRTREYFVHEVRSSNGQLQVRYSIRTQIILERKIFRITLTLSDRSEMGYPLLIGRKALRSRFLVNVELNEQLEPMWKF